MTIILGGDVEQEIEEDFMVMSLFPGLQLMEVTTDSYKFPELIENNNQKFHLLREVGRRIKAEMEDIGLFK
ncbi:hypothetical protein V6N13_071873 [Hibiscus sabdariffa]|uniref:Uncharacterized protein n=1 Tax=Hibiscus sabdariffa TaxID=183260 RepID=A0ABR2TCV2_9ROSI